MDSIRSTRSRLAFAAALCGLALLLGLSACDGRTPTEVDVTPASGSESAALRAVGDGPPTIFGCPFPSDQNGEPNGPQEQLVTEVAGVLTDFTPPVEACVTVDHNERRTMTIELQLDEGLYVPGDRPRFGDRDYPHWLCPVPGPLGSPDRLLWSDNWSFRVSPAGVFTGKCVAYE